MARLAIFILLTLSSFYTGFSQKQFTLERIWGGEFLQTRLGAIQHLNNGTEYSVFEYNRAGKETKIVAKSYTNSEKQRVLLSSLDIPKLTYFETYKFSADETKVLLGLNYKSLYRYSTAGEFYVYSFDTKKVIRLGQNLIFNPSFSPDGLKVAYVESNNLFVYDLVTNKTIQVTTDGKKNSIINGRSDWVYEEEFELVSAYEWNAASTHLAYLKFNETEVKQYSMPVYGNSNYPTETTFKYPKAGENNSVVSAHIFSLKSKKTTPINLNKEASDYIPRIQWTKDANLLCVQLMNRKQNKLEFTYVSSSGKPIKPFYTETDNAYVEITDDLTFLDDHSFIKSNEKSGYRHLYHYTKDGKQIAQITHGDWEVTDFYGVNNNTIYYQSTEGRTTERHIYSIDLDGSNKKCLTVKRGTHKANFNSDYSFFVDSYSSIDTPLSYTVKKTNTGETATVLVSNSLVKAKVQSYAPSKKRIKTISINGATLNMWMLKPNDFDSSNKYPVLLYQYSGPGSQMVANRWNNYNDYWHQLLVQKGYIVACVDGRGTGYKGAAFKKQTQNQLGKLEALDQIEFAKELGKLPYVDKERIGIWGWSYGGFNALNAILKGNTVFKTAIAVAPVTHWKFYDTIYTERFLDTPQNNQQGYDENSPLSHADKLRGNVLLVHGTADDNVHFQNTLAMVNAFTKANKQFDLAIYTDKNHGIYGGNTRLQLYTKITNYILEKL